MRLLQRHGKISPILEAPWVKTHIFRFDWLHAADQGATADFIGNVFHYLQENHMQGATIEQRYTALFLEQQQFYEDEGVLDRMDALKPKFVENRQGMKLRASGAECRALVPFVLRLARELCDKTDPVENAIYWASFHLCRVYGALSASTPDAQAQMKESSILFATQYVALHDHFNGGDDRLFRIKPKMHWFMHLCDGESKPSMNWLYRDEDFGGSVAAAARRRGGLLSPGASSFNVLEMLALVNPRISIRQLCALLFSIM